MTGLRRNGLRWFVALLAVAALLAGLMREAVGAIALGSSAGTQGAGVSSLTWSHSIAAGSDRLLIVRVANINAGVSVSGVTYGGVALTQLQTATSGGGPSNVRASVWYRLAPAVGTANVVVTLSGSTRVQGYSTNLTGVSQTTPFGTVATATGTNNAVSVTAAGAAGDLMFDTAAAQGGAGSATAGGGQSPISGSTGPTASDVLGMGSTKAGAASVTLSWTTTASSPWVSIGVAIKQAVGYTVSGTVFEDLNYGGGAGRSLAASSGAGVSGATVELYNSSGTYISSTTTAGDGSYGFASLVAGTYHVRVVNSTVASQRSGAVASLRGVMTYRSNASSGSAVAVTDFVGGTNPALVDPGAGGSGATFNTTSGIFSAGPSGTAQSYSVVTVGSASIGNIDFGFNFDTVVNTNNSGQGSLRQALTNANTLGGDASLAQLGRGPSVENLVFMIGNGTAAAGLRSSINLFSGGVATIAPTSALPTITSRLVLDAQTQPGWTSAPLIDLNGAGAGNGSTGLALQAVSGAIVRGLVIRNFDETGLSLDSVSGSTVAGNYLGLDAAGTAAAANGTQGLNLWNSNNNTIGGTTTADRNVISGNTNIGIVITGNSGGGTGNTVGGNYIGTNAAGTAAVANGSIGVYLQSPSNTIGGTAAGAGNVISGNTYSGLVLDTGATGTTVQGNRIGTNAAGSAALANGTHGIHVLSANNILGGTAASAGNLVSGNAQQGMWVQANGNLIQGNIIGLNAAGNAKVRNAQNGIVLYAADNNTIGGSAAGARNVVSGHDSLADFWDGIYLYTGSDNNTIQGNYLGTDITGTVAFGNSYSGVSVWGGVNNTIGGTGAGQGNLIAYNGRGMDITHSTGATTGNRISGNSIHSNVNGGILLESGLPANDGTTTAAKGNLLTDAPVLSSATYDGSTLTVAGHVGSAAGQAAFANHTVEVFASATTSGTGQGRSYLGSLNTSGSNGNFSGSLSGVTLSAGTYITATATSGANNTSIFSPNRLPITLYPISGTVFEDLNYGGGAGRSLAASGGTGLAGARVELYDSTGSFVSATTTAAGGAYSLSGVVSGAYTVRVANASVLSSRPGASASQLGVMTYRTEAASGAAVAVSNHVGGLDPTSADAAAGAGGTVLWTLCAAENATCSFSGTRIVRYGAYSAGNSRWVTLVLTGGTACSNAVFGDPYPGAPKNCYLFNAAYQSVANVAVGSAAVTGIHFGFNFDTVVNTNDSGQGSLRQALTNANALGGDATLAQSGRTAAIENLVFMIGNGTAAAGLRSPVNLFSGGVASVALASALPTLTAPVVIDAHTQPGWTLAPIVELNGSGAGSTAGLTLNGAGSVVRGLVVNRFNGAGLSLGAAGNTVAGNWIGLNSAGTAASANGGFGIHIVTGGSNTVGGSTAAARNVISGNGNHGIEIAAGNSNTIQGNYFGTNAAGTAAVANAGAGLYVHASTGSNTIGGSSAGQGNVLSGNAQEGIVLRGGSGGNVLRGNIIGLNATASAAVANAAGIALSISGSNNQIGGTGAGDGNTISGNTGAGVLAFGNGSSGNSILGNSIHANGSIGIDLGTAAGTSGDGITANDGAKTTGQPNLRMDSPVFTSARSRGSQLTVAGYVGSAAGQTAFAGSRVEVFISDSTGANGSGRSYLGALSADASGNFSGTITMPYNALRAGSGLTGTATDTANNTSEFGANFSALRVDWLINHNGDGVDANPGDGLCETSTPGQCSLRAAIMESNAWAGADLAVFDLPSCPGAGCIITPASALPAITGPLTLDGQTQPGWTAAPLVDLRGEAAGASTDGLTVNAAGSIVRGLAVGGFLQSGIRINADSVLIEANHVGVQPDGTTARANGAANTATGGVYVAGGTGIVIGGATAAQRNVLSGNGGSGVRANGGTVTILGNHIGTNAAGTAALGNGRWGVSVVAGTGHRVGGAAAGEGNVISGNAGDQRGGVLVNGIGQTVQGNTIGLNAARSAAIPNGFASADPYAGGIDVRGGSGHLIGGTSAGEGNLISGNLGFGVRVSAQTTRVLGNSIYGNSRLGIDLNGDEVTTNNGTQSVSLPNNDMDHPAITSAGYDPGTRALTLTGVVGIGTGQALFAGARIELFTSDGDASGYGEGSAFVGTLTADADGRFSGTVSVPVAVTFAVGSALTGTATDSANNTSEFGPNHVTTTMSALAPSRFNAFETSTAAGALTGPIQTRVAGVAGDIALIAIDNTGTALQTAFAGTVTLEWMNASDNSGALDAGNCRASWVASGSAGSSGFVSGDQGRRNTSVTPAAVGREWRLRISYAGPGGTVTSCATDPFAVRPATLVITGVSDSNDTTAGTTRALDNLAASGGRVHHAGRPFSLRAAARDAASAVTAGYTGAPALAITGCVLPAGCTPGVLSAPAPALAASSGLIAADTLSYSEVGAINVQLTDDTFADIDTADTPLLQRRIQSAVLGVGRFVPDRYLLAVGTSPQFATQQGSCAAAGQGFTFVGQNFGWATAPSFTVTAQNAAGGTTTLWGGSLQKLSTAHIARSLAAANAQGLTPVVSWGSMVLADTGSGTASVALSGDQFLFTRDAATPVASFNPLITLGIAVSDSSETAVIGNSAIASATALVIGSGTGIAFNQGSHFHYARLKLQNAFGDARRGVRANVELQKFSDRGWLRLSEDNTCLTVLQASVAFSAGSGAFATDVCTAPASAALALRQGRGTLVLPKTAGNLQGAAMVTLNIGAALEGNACAAGVPVSPTSSAWPHLLGARGSGATQDQNPAARLVWGRQHRDYMVMRELF